MPELTERDKIKADVNNFLLQMDEVGNIDYDVYSSIYDAMMENLDRMYELGQQERVV